jgi:23S rRNA pseudouridine1911/1915/1917 synthase
MFRQNEVHKTYWCIVPNVWRLSLPRGTKYPEKEADLKNWLVRNERLNRSRAFDEEKRDSKEARLHYRTLATTDRYALLEVQLYTGRHHQIRCQLSHIGLPIKGDLKYGAPRSNPDGGICLHARRVSFIHPVSQQEVVIEADVPSDPLWRDLAAMVTSETPQP